MVNKIQKQNSRAELEKSKAFEQKWLELIYRGVSDCLFLIAVEGEISISGDDFGRYRFISVNDAFLQMTGWTTEQVIGKYVEEVMPESAHTLVFGKYRKALTSNATITWEEKSVYPTGGLVGEIKVTPVRDADSGNIYLVGAARDVTQAHEQANRVRKNEELLRALLRNFPNGSVNVFDKDLRYILAEGEGLRQVNLVSENLVGKTIFELYPQQLAEYAAQYYRQVFDGKTTSFELKLHNQTYKITATPLRDETGKIYSVLAVAVNISDYKEAENALRDLMGTQRIMAEQQSAILNALPAHIALLDRTGNIVSVNNAWLRFAEANAFPSADFGVGQNYLEISENAHGDCAEEGRRTAAGIRSVLSGYTKQFEMEYPCHSPQEKRWFRLMVSPLPVDDSAVSGGVVVMHVDVTHRKAAEEALRESETQFRAVFEHSLDGMLIGDNEGLYLNANRAICELLKVSKNEIIGYSVADFVPLEPDDDLQARWQQFLERGAENGVIELRDALGEKLLVEYNAQANILPGRHLSVMRDVTARHRAEEALKKSEEHFRSLIDNSYDIISIHDRDGVMIYQSPSIKPFLGYEQEELTGKRLVDYLHPEDVPAVEKAIDSMKARRNEPHIVETRFRHKDGSWRMFECTGVNLFENPAVGGIVFNARDITERKQAEQKIVERDRLLSISQQISQTGSWEWDLNTNTFLWTDEEYRIFGLEPQSESPSLEMFLEFVHPDDRSQFFAPFAEIEDKGKIIENLKKIIESEQPLAFDYRIVLRDGQVKTLRSMRKVIIDEATGEPLKVIGTEQDITSTRLLEEQLRQSQRLEAVGQFAGGVAHDFNNMLTAINGYSELLLAKLSANDPLRVYVEEITKAGNRSSTLTSQLLAYSRKQILQPKIINLNAIVADINKMLQRVIGEDIILNTVFDQDLWNVRADPTQIVQIVLNLAVNARDAMAAGGSLLIETQNVRLDAEYAIHHTDIVPGAYVMLAVTDTGEGMSPDIREKIFEPFFTTKQNGKGTGMGLATVYGIVKQSGGAIWVYSEVRHGTTFKIYLPCVEDENAVAAETHFNDDSGQFRSGSETILLVEDEELVRMVVRQILEESGYTVVECTSGADAVLLFERDHEKIALVLTDAVMPNMSGRELSERLLQIKPALKVLYMSGYTPNAVVHGGLLDDNTAFIQKPFTAEELSRKIREILDGEF